jgi:mono/diheme cytochrome c family protein
MSRLRCIPILSAVALLTSCGTARRSEPLIGERRPPSGKLALGEEVFDRQCSQCHPGGESGLGPALNNKPLPRFAMKIQIRNGVGAMPRFSSNEITDEQVSAVTEYLVWLRRQR